MRSNLITGLLLGVCIGSISACGSDATSPPDVVVVPPAPSGINISGTAAMGAPIANAAIAVKDKNGTSKSGTTDAAGKYSIDVGGLTPPFLVRVTLSSGAAIYSIGAAAGVVNVHPYTDLAIGLWYQVQGTTLAAAFSNPVGSPMPDTKQLSGISNTVTGLLQKWLVDNGVSTTTFDLVSTPFDANGAGFDKVLASSVVGNGTITIKDSPTIATVTQISTVAVNTATSSATVTTTTTSSAGTSTGIATVVVPTKAASQNALNVVSTALAQLVSVVNSKGAALTDKDLTALFDSDYLEDGFNATIATGVFADAFRGTALTSAVVTRIVSYDDVNKIITVVAALALPGQSATQPVLLSFKQQGSTEGSWLLYGNRRPAESSLQVETRTDDAGTTKSINVDVRALKGRIQSVVVNGGGIFNNISVPKSSTDFVEEFKNTPTTTLTLNEDAFFYLVTVPSFPAPGTVFTITVNPVSGAPVAYTVVTEGTTTEAIAITSPTAHLLADAKLGQVLSVNWTKMKTFAVVAQDFSGQVSTANKEFSCRIDAQVGVTGIAGTITLPATCGGKAVTSAGLNVSVSGQNGERSHVIYDFQ